MRLSSNCCQLIILRERVQTSRFLVVFVVVFTPQHAVRESLQRSDVIAAVFPQSASRNR